MNQKTIQNWNIDDERKKHFVGVRLPDDVFGNLRRYAQEKDITISEAIREALVIK